MAYKYYKVKWLKNDVIKTQLLACANDDRARAHLEEFLKYNPDSAAVVTDMDDNLI